MKILKRNDDFRKMPEKCVEDVLAIKSLINQGWNYCSKEVYKDSVGRKETKATKAEKVAKEKEVKQKIVKEKTSEKKSDNKKSSQKTDKKKGKK